MITERFIIATRAEPKVSVKNNSKDAGIYIHELQPESALRCAFKNSTAPVNAVAASSTHIFAAQVEKAVVHVYSRERGNQETIISFPERIHSLSLVGDTVLVLGTAEGRIILWEVSTGRLITTPAAHLQAVGSVATTALHLISGSEDSHIHVWSIPHLLSISSDVAQEPLRSFSNHKTAVTSLAIGHSSSNINICVSASNDRTVIVWNYHSGQLLRTFLLPSLPLCLALDPCDRGVYVGSHDGSVQLIEFSQSDSIKNPLYDTTLQTTPLQVTSQPWESTTNAGSTLCIGINYDGTLILTGHVSGKIYQWNVGRRRFASEIAEMSAPVTNLIFETPFPMEKKFQISTVAKPRLGEKKSLLTGHFIGSSGFSNFDHAVAARGIPTDKLEDAISKLNGATSNVSDKLREENDALWKIINEQREIQMKTWEKYSSLRTGST